MKKIKKITSLVLALVMAMAMTITSFAAPGNGTKKDQAFSKAEKVFTITLKGKQTGHTYSAYQIFKGDLLVKDAGTEKEKRYLSNIEWGDGVKAGPALITALKAKNAAFTGLGENATATEVVKILQNQPDDSQLAKDFAEVVGGTIDSKTGKKSGFINESVKTNSQEGAKDKNDYVYTISGLSAGYYLVEDSNIGEGNNTSYTRYMMEVVGAVTAKVKAVVPDIDKKIVMGSDKVSANSTGIDQSVYYEITGEVPDRTGYKQYFYVINDKLSEGLTFQDDIEVTVGGKKLATDNYIVYTGNEAEGNTFQIAFRNFVNETIYPEGAQIVVTYTAILNENAKIGNPGNPNETFLRYSNNPNMEGDGENPDKPGTPLDTVPTGEGPKKITLTFTAEIKLHKVNGKQEALPGVKFRLYGLSRDPIAIGEEYYTVSNDGTYYLLKDGTYTTTKPVEEVRNLQGEVTTKSNEDLYVSTTIKYKKEKADKAMVGESHWVTMEAETDSDGNITFERLGTGTYIIEEVEAPAGYNKGDNVTVVIECEVPSSVASGEEKAVWSLGANSSENVTLVLNDAGETTGSYGMEIVNLAGSLLPSTGGIGTTIFYIVGGILAVGAGVLLIMRKRMKKDK